MNQLALTPTPILLSSPAEPEVRLNRSIKHASVILVALVAGLGGATALVPISSAVIAGGEVTVASRTKKIAHPRGGVLAALNIDNGSRVRAGQTLLRLDTNVSAASADMAAQSIDQLLAREARLLAQRDGLAAMALPKALRARLGDPVVAAIIRGEQRAFALGREAQAGQRAAIAQQIRQAEESIRGYAVQADVYRKQESLIAEEQAANDQLWEKRFTTLQRRNELNRTAVGLRGSAASAETSVAQLRARIAELRERSYLIEDTARREAGTELGTVQARLLELRQNNVVAQDTDARNIIRAPYDGIIDKLAFTTIGGVVPAGETILEIVPVTDPLVVTARVNPEDIDQLSIGGEVSLRFSAFNMQTTPQIGGVLTKVSADRSVDPQSGRAFFPVQISISPAEQKRLGALKLRPGMPVEAFIRTGERTLMSYILKPLSDQVSRAFR